jgi:hypothetical protein
VGAWNLALQGGAAFKVNRSPSQVNFEIEGGYRIWRSLELNGYFNLRFINDKNIGFGFMPSYAWRVTSPDQIRIDVRPTAGLGWSLRSIRGSTFQLGYFTMRAGCDGVFYFFRNFSMIAGMKLETFLVRTETGGQGTTNELGASGGPPTQFLTSVGLRFEF